MTDNDTQAREDRINARLVGTGEMDSDLSLTLAGWQVGILKQAAQDTAQEALNALAQSPEHFLHAIAAQDGLNRILAGFMDPFFSQCGEKIDGTEEQPDIELTFVIKVSALTAFASLIVSCIVHNDIPKPTSPMPPADDPDAMVSDQMLLWWALIRLFNQFPASVQTVLTEETDMNFEEIR